MTSVVRRLQVLALAFAAFIGLVLTAPNFVNTASAATVQVNLFCTSDGWAFNASYTGNRNSKFNAAYQYDSRRGGFGGGTYSWEPMGKVVTGNQGIGSSNTIYIKEPRGTAVDVEVRIGGVIGKASRTC